MSIHSFFLFHSHSDLFWPIIVIPNASFPLVKTLSGLPVPCLFLFFSFAASRNIPRSSYILSSAHYVFQPDIFFSFHCSSLLNIRGWGIYSRIDHNFFLSPFPSTCCNFPNFCISLVLLTFALFLLSLDILAVLLLECTCTSWYILIVLFLHMVFVFCTSPSFNIK